MASEGTLQVQFRAGDILPALEARKRSGGAGDARSLGLVAQRDLARYYYLLARITPAFSVAEASLLVDVCNGWLVEPHTAGLLWAEVADGITNDKLDAKWGIDGPGLVTRLRGLSYAEALAICDAAERFWELSTQGVTTEEGVRAVGLVRAGG